jgi:hypothetical protein
MSKVDTAIATKREPLTAAQRQQNRRARVTISKHGKAYVNGRPGYLTLEEKMFINESIEKEINSGNIVTVSWVQELVSFFVFLIYSLLTSILLYKTLSR